MGAGNTGVASCPEWHFILSFPQAGAQEALPHPCLTRELGVGVDSFLSSSGPPQGQAEDSHGVHEGRAGLSPGPKGGVWVWIRYCFQYPPEA